MSATMYNDFNHCETLEKRRLNKNKGNLTILIFHVEKSVFKLFWATISEKLFRVHGDE